MAEHYESRVFNVVHEIGHAYDYLTWDKKNDNTMRSYYLGKEITDYRNEIFRPNNPEYWTYQQHPENAFSEDANDEMEIFADMFIAWTYDAWNTSSGNTFRVNLAQNWAADHGMK